MIYIVVLNWNSAEDTIHCIKSLLRLNNQEKISIVICDNASKTESIEEICQFVLSFGENESLIINENDILKYKNIKNKITLIKNNENYGYAGGNNRGVKLALFQDDMKYVWILNNDTEVAIDSLDYLVSKFDSNYDYGVVGSKLVNFEDRNKVQAVGGVINPKFCTTKEIGSEFKADDIIDEMQYEQKIDYVVGASMLFSRACIEKVGLMCEDYFLYYEEMDICNRIRQKGLKVGISSQSIIYHKQGASTAKLSDVADECQVRNKIVFSKKFHPNNVFFVKSYTFLVILNRIKRGQLYRARKYLKFLAL